MKFLNVFYIEIQGQLALLMTDIFFTKLSSSFVKDEDSCKTASNTAVTRESIRCRHTSEMNQAPRSHIFQ